MTMHRIDNRLENYSSSTETDVLSADDDKGGFWGGLNDGCEDGSADWDGAKLSRLRRRLTWR